MNSKYGHESMYKMQENAFSGFEGKRCMQNVNQEIT
jgi:hypothetical protein